MTFELRYVQQAQTKRTVAPMYSGSTLSSSSTPSFYGPYWYAEKRNGDRVIWVYVGKRFDKNKARQRLLRKGARS